jgi:hypothetical protein
LKPILISVIAVVSILVAVPAVTVASMEMESDSCGTNPLHANSSNPACCLIGECPFYNCSLSNAADNMVLIHSRFIPNKNIPIVLSRITVSNEISSNPKVPRQRELTQELPSDLHSVFRCRNSLDSEEPIQA